MSLVIHTPKIDVFQLPEGLYLAVTNRGEWLAKGRTISAVMREAKKNIEYMR